MAAKTAAMSARHITGLDQYVVASSRLKSTPPIGAPNAAWSLTRWDGVTCKVLYTWLDACSPSSWTIKIVGACKTGHLGNLRNITGKCELEQIYQWMCTRKWPAENCRTQSQICDRDTYDYTPAYAHTVVDRLIKQQIDRPTDIRLRDTIETRVPRYILQDRV